MMPAAWPPPGSSSTTSTRPRRRSGNTWPVSRANDGSPDLMIVGTAAHPFRPFEEWLRVARLVEELGYGMTCQSQNPVLRGDPFVELGVAARETRSVLLATTVA